MKSVFVTEKPSVAMTYAKTLGVVSKEKHDGYIENDEDVCPAIEELEKCYTDKFPIEIMQKNALKFVRKMEEEIKEEQKALSNGEEPGYIE